MAAEGYAIHRANIDEQGGKFGRFTYQRIAPGAFLSAADLLRAQQMRSRLIDEAAPTLARFDVLLAPGTLFLPPVFTDFGEDWPPAPHLTATRTVAANVLGTPSLSLPIGKSGQGLPIALQVMGAPFHDHTVLEFACLLRDFLGDHGQVRADLTD